MTTIAKAPRPGDIGITGDQERLVYECLAEGGRKTLDDIRWHLHQAGEMARETTISARIRDINRKLRGRGLEIKWQYVEPGSRNTVYWME